MKAGKGDKVRLLKLPNRPVPRLRVGAIGEVIGLRISDEHVCVKWRGRSWPVTHSQDEVEKINLS